MSSDHMDALQAALDAREHVARLQRELAEKDRHIERLTRATSRHSIAAEASLACLEIVDSAAMLARRHMQLLSEESQEISEKAHALESAIGALRSQILTEYR